MDLTSGSDVELAVSGRRRPAAPSPPLHPSGHPSAAPSMLAKPLRHIVESHGGVTLRGDHLGNRRLKAMQPAFPREALRRLVTQADYARRRGISRRGLQTHDRGGRPILTHGPKKLIDVAEADALWEATKSPAGASHGDGAG